MLGSIVFTTFLDFFDFVSQDFNAFSIFFCIISEFLSVLSSTNSFDLVDNGDTVDLELANSGAPFAFLPETADFRDRALVLTKLGTGARVGAGAGLLTCMR